MKILKAESIDVRNEFWGSMKWASRWRNISECVGGDMDYVISELNARGMCDFSFEQI